jgi:riboflavin kinase/FMN adenylyltransferase
MQVHFEVNNLPAFRNAVVTIGAFDGVHQGHRTILAQLKKIANSLSGETVVITFHPHPRRILNNAEAPSLLTSLDERISLFSSIGIDHLAIIPFNHAFASLAAEEYVKEFLVKHFNPKAIVIGFDHRFGKNRTGDYFMLEKQGEIFGFDVFEIPEYVLNESKVSSTQIRQALLSGGIQLANSLLTYPYQLSGTVIEGDKLGRTIGFPTANLSMLDNDKLIPASGVYAVRVYREQDNSYSPLNGMMNIGYRPTVNGRERRIEVHIFDFNEDIYHETLKVDLVFHTRKELKFDGINALKQQLEKDQIEISQLLQKFTEQP